LADRAGALAQAATVIGMYGGNIISIDVHRTDSDAAVDDLVVEFTGEPDLQDLRDDLAIDASATLVAHEPAHPLDPVVAALGQVVKLVEADLGQRAAALASGIGELCFCPVVWVSGTEEASRYELGRLAVERNTAIVSRTNELPQHMTEILSGEVCLLAIPDLQRQGAGRVVFAARPATNAFTATEISRIEALVAVDNHVERLVG
jgi:hypothetical protein